MQEDRWTDDFLESMRGVGDPIADDAVAEVFALGQANRVNDISGDFDKNSEAVPGDLPPRLRQYFEETAKLPAWADPAQIERGNDLLGRYGPQIVSILHCASLPICYGGAKGVQVLYQSQRIHGQVFRRIMETAQFVLDVLDEGGLGPSGRGRRTSQKIRLLHATIRHHIRHQADSNPGTELAINQEDLAGTMFSFSVTIPRGLSRLGIELEKADRDSFYHIWSVIGHLLGIDRRLIPASYEEGASLLDRILERQWAPSEAGREVTKALLDYMQGALPGGLLDGGPPTLIRHLAGDRVADILAVPKADWTRLIFSLGAGLNSGYVQVGDHSALAAKLASQIGLLLLKGSVLASNQGQRYEWRIPSSVSERWGEQA